jgi:hypothetical protein
MPRVILPQLCECTTRNIAGAGARPGVAITVSAQLDRKEWDEKREPPGSMVTRSWSVTIDSNDTPADV